MVKTATYIGSYVKPDQCPDDLPGYAFIGRSNVGKSSLINLITGRKALAKTSRTPGKTQTINHFRINDAWYLVDLPGLGYAKASKKLRQQWERFIKAYLTHDTLLSCVFYLVDASISPQPIDLEFMNWLGKHQLPFVIVYTKTDKGKAHQIRNNIKDFNHELRQTWEFLTQAFQTSYTKRLGADALVQFIEETNEEMMEES